jgi:tRNA(Leu) C34 or U34 (ribose-2'-O)-methylase TrmL
VRGYFSIGVWHPKCEANIGTLWRHAYLFGAAMIFTVGARYRKQQTDTLCTANHVPLMHFETLEDLHAHLPENCSMVAVEMCEKAKPLRTFTHDERALYLLGAEDRGLPEEVLTKAHRRVYIECPTDRSMNVAVAGSIIMYDRYLKGGPKG